MLFAYNPSRYPNFSENVNLFSQLGQAGAGIIEIDIPFSDPVANGEIIHATDIPALRAI